jgi:hypothetical protein
MSKLAGLLAAAAVCCVTGVAFAQGPGDGELRAPPPSPSGRSPSAPDASPSLKAPPVPESAAPADNRANRGAARCAELSGATREQCLLETQSSGTGATSVPEPRTAPPPQNPR